MEELTALSGMSMAQIERYCKRIFHLTPRQMIHKVRLEKATELLAGDTPITDIALQCGYTDHSAFSRQFKAMTGSTPRDFRLTLPGKRHSTVLISSSKGRKTDKPPVPRNVNLSVNIHHSFTLT
jgi:AraC-like DNA-binding protein